MNAHKYLSLGLVFIIGCTTSMATMIKNVNDQYEEVISDDGVDLEEANIIAQKQLIKKNVVEIYDLTKPRVKKDVNELPDYQDYWFIFFEEKKPSNIPFIFMVVIHKENGKVKFADDYNEEKDWILEAALLHD